MFLCVEVWALEWVPKTGKSAQVLHTIVVPVVVFVGVCVWEMLGVWVCERCLECVCVCEREMLGSHLASSL